MNANKLTDWIIWGNHPIVSRLRWNQEVLKAKHYLENGLYSQEEFADKILELRRKKYHYNSINSDFNN
jgi:hypothetical protein